jgi:CRP/FNR family transcriptional regulator
MSTDLVAGTKVPPPLGAGAQPWILDALSERTRTALLASAVERRFAAGEILYLAGSPAQWLYVVLDGRVRLLRERHGRALLVHEEERGGCLGEVPLFEGTTYPATAMAAEPTRCLVLHRDVILEAVRTESEFALVVLARLAARVRHLVDRLDRNASHSTLGRLAEHLLARSIASRGRSFTLGASQQQAAEELGTVRELVVRGLRTLRDRGAIVAHGGGRYSVTDEVLLREIASDG